MPPSEPFRSTDIELADTRPADADLVPSERDARTGRPAPSDRSDKHRNRPRQHTPPSNPSYSPPAMAEKAPPIARPRIPRRMLVVAGAGIATVAVVLAAVLIGRSGSTPPGAVAAAVTTSTAAQPTSTPAVAGATAPTGPLTNPESSTLQLSTVQSSVLESTALESSTVPAGSPVGSPTPSTAVGAGSSISARPSTAPAVRALTGFTATTTVTKVVNSSKSQSEFKVGQRANVAMPCRAGRCQGALASLRVDFRLGAPTVTVRRIYQAGNVPTPCDPTTVALSMTRQPDGSYRGTVSNIPAKVEGHGSLPGGGTVDCYSFAVVESVALTPTFG